MDYVNKAACSVENDEELIGTCRTAARAIRSELCRTQPNQVIALTAGGDLLFSLITGLD